MDNKKQVYDKLKDLDIKYTVSEHKAAFTIDDMNKLNLNTNGIIAKNLFLRDAKGKRHLLITIPHNKSLDLKSLRVELKTTSLSFASEDRLMKCMRLNKGSVTPFGILNDTEKNVEVFFDSEFLDTDIIGIHPNDNSATVWLLFKDLKNVISLNGHSFKYVSIKQNL